MLKEGNRITMSTITYKQEARCSGCMHLGYKYIGVRKHIWCKKNEKFISRKDNAGKCIVNGDFIMIYSK
jgi:hypothetical protein